jgi:hypothetical protein
MEKSPPRSYKKQQKIEKTKTIQEKKKEAQSNQHQSIFEHNKKS